MAKKFKADMGEVKRSLKVFGWSFGSALIVFIIDLVANLDVPKEYIGMIPTVNVVLYALKEFIQSNDKRVS